ncbi:MAG: ABC transporter substrate-binding protein [Lachnospiraceae bacterium]|nr:ABC transporter substrate-binding protein [Lachnospiraceae bacterium]
MKKKFLSVLFTAALSMTMAVGSFSSGAFAEETEAETAAQADTADEAAEAETAAQANAAGEAAEAETAAETDTADEAAEAVRIGALSGPTAMGLVKLMQDAEDGITENTYQFADLSTDPSTFVAPLAKGDIDIAAVPSNLASVIYNNTDGTIEVLAVNTLGVLDIVERGDTVESFADLKGKTIYATGQGATPEYSLRYLLSQNGLDPDQDVTIQWCADTTEALSYISSDEAAIAMIPQPFATVAQTKVDGLRIALVLNDEWNKLDNGSSLVTGVVVTRKAFAEDNPDKIAAFLKEYEFSANYALTNIDETAALIEKYGIVPGAVAKKALPDCNITYLTGSDMKAALSGYLQILNDQNPASIGGAMPGDDFYYEAE